MKAWMDLTPEAHMALRTGDQTHFDAQPPTCSMDGKVAAFATWLRLRDVSFSRADVSRKDP